MEKSRETDLQRQALETIQSKQMSQGIGKLDISEAGAYAYAAICSITLAELFPNDWDKEFKRKSVNTLCRHLEMNDRVVPVMLNLIEQQSEHSQDPYLTIVSNEPSLKGKAITLLQDLILLAVHEGEYDARQRVLARRVAELLNVPFELVELYEHSLVKLLSEEIETESEDQKKETHKRDKIRKIKRYTAIGLATISGGTLIGLTGGLAAPFIGVGIGSVLGGATAAALSTTAGAAIIGSIFGFAGAGLTGYKMKKRVGEVEEFGFVPVTKMGMMDQELHIAIAITGWLKSEDPFNIVKPWQCLAVSQEQYALKYETKYLIELGQALEYIWSIAVGVATQEALKYTILSSLVSAVAWPAALLSMASVIDNPWSVCCRRSSEVGKQLAHVLLTRQHGKRPVTLVGFSLGARVIFYCLREMAEIGGGEGIIQDVVMLGAPVTDSKKQWEKCSKIVAGKLVNGYCSADWLLRFLYRTLSMTSGVAGLMQIQCSRVSNVDLSPIVSGHSEYPEKMPELLRHIGLNTREVQVIDTEGIMRKSNSDIPHPPSTDTKADVILKSSKSDQCISSTKCLNGNHVSESNSVRKMI